MNSGKIVADGTGDIEGSTRGPRGPKKVNQLNWFYCLCWRIYLELPTDIYLPNQRMNMTFGASLLVTRYSIVFSFWLLVGASFLLVLYWKKVKGGVTTLVSKLSICSIYWVLIYQYPLIRFYETIMVFFLSWWLCTNACQLPIMLWSLKSPGLSKLASWWTRPIQAAEI